MPDVRRISRRQLAHLLLGVPWLAACGTSAPAPTATRTFFEVPTATPVSPTSTPAATTAATAPTLITGQSLPADPGREASARVFSAPPSAGASTAARQPAPTRLIIPAIGLDARIVSIGTRLDPNGNLIWETAAHAVGHHQGSANPSEPGNVVLSGHISSEREGNVFAALPSIKVGDGIVLRTPGRDHLYAVDSLQTVLPSDVHVLEPTDKPCAILITCVPDRVYTHRLIVRASYV